MLKFLFGFLFFTVSAFAWDEHVLMTQHTLNGLKRTQPSLFKKIKTEKIQVTPIEQFLTKAFGYDCNWNLAKETVYGGLGNYYEVLYEESVSYKSEIDWAKGINRAKLIPSSSKNRLQDVGKWVSPYDVLSIYSDEPDWVMDDDVDALKGKGFANDMEGAAMRVLRHFWFKGEYHLLVNLSKDQETDKRMQLFYELALVAFEVDEPYWGYRFLANVLHYIQDLTQPFHVKGLPDDGMVRGLKLAHGLLCSEIRKGGKEGTHCKPEDSLDSAVIEAGWVLGTYHLMYEEFSRALLSVNRYGTSWWVADTEAYVEKYRKTENVFFTDSDGLLDLLKTPDAEQQAVLPWASKVGSFAYKVFGKKPVHHPEVRQEEFKLQGTSRSYGYRIGGNLSYDESLLRSMNQRQVDAIPRLVEATHEVMAKAGVWGREFIRLGLESRNLFKGKELRWKYAAMCSF